MEEPYHKDDLGCRLLCVSSFYCIASRQYEWGMDTFLRMLSNDVLDVVRAVFAECDLEALCAFFTLGG